MRSAARSASASGSDHVSGWTFEIYLGLDREPGITKGVAQAGAFATRLRSRLEQTYGPLVWTCVDGESEASCEGWSAELARNARLTCCGSSCLFAVGRPAATAGCDGG